MAAPSTKKGSDAKYFATTAKGEIHEWKNDLNSFNKDKIKEAVKKVIAAMTVGKDVSSLFTDVIKGMQTDNIELKKLVYLYIINYARSQPDKAILIVNTFQRDALDKSPLVRALAIRTMGCIRVDRITEYLCEPLAKALKDKDPYVRKTAAVCVAKLYDINKDLVEEQGFLEILRGMISDSNPMVIANAVAALAEIAETSHKDVFQINATMLTHLLAALNQCTEWGVVFILDCLAKYEPAAKDAEDIIERVSPWLKHVNSAVSMSAVKVIMKYLNYVSKPALEKKILTEKLPPPLITLLSEHRPEIQYVALRNINLIVQKKPAILSNGVKHFFCKYNDPIYVKMEKLEIMIKIANNKNIEKVLMELKEYATEVDVEFVRKSVLAIGRCAIKLEKAAERCVKVLLELIQTKVNYVVQEAIIVIKDIFRKYPNKYESIISTLCENLDTLDEPEAKASMIWIIGEYAARIDNAHDLLNSFIENFLDENPQVQLQLLTAVVKLFLVKPAENKAMVERVLDMATQNSDNPDLRDRGYVYWRLLSKEPEAARAVVCGEKPVISDDTFQLEPSVLDVLIANISTLASIYHKPPEYFIKDGKSSIVLKPKSSDKKSGEESDEESSEGEEGGAEGGAGGGGEGDVADSADVEEEGGGERETPSEEKKKVATPSPAPAASGQPEKPTTTTTASSLSADFDLLGLGLDLGQPETKGPSSDVQAKELLSRQQGKGLQIRAVYARQNGVPTINFSFDNGSSTALSKFQIKFRQNELGVTPAGSSLNVGTLSPGAVANVGLGLVVSSENTDLSKPIVEMAIKTELGVCYFKDRIPAHILFDEKGKLETEAFLKMWKEIGDGKEQSKTLSTQYPAEVIQERFTSNGLYHIASRSTKKIGKVMYFSLRFREIPMLVEITLKGDACKVCLRSSDDGNGKVALAAVVGLIG